MKNVTERCDKSQKGWTALRGIFYGCLPSLPPTVSVPCFHHKMAPSDSYSDGDFSGGESGESQLGSPSPSKVRMSDRINQILKKMNGKGDASPKASLEEAKKESNAGYCRGAVVGKMKVCLMLSLVMAMRLMYSCSISV